MAWRKKIGSKSELDLLGAWWLERKKTARVS